MYDFNRLDGKPDTLEGTLARCARQECTLEDRSRGAALIAPARGWTRQLRAASGLSILRCL